MKLDRTQILLGAVLIFIVITFFARGYENNTSYLSGDEPHFIMMTDSLVKDGDFNLKNDYDLQRSLSYYPIPGLFPHLAPIIDYKNSDKWYSIHTIGLPLLLFYPYKLFGLVGVRVYMLMLQSTSILFFYFLLKKYIKDSNRVFLGMILISCCPFIWENLGVVFPDLLMTSMLGAVLLLFGRKGWSSNLALASIVIIGLLIHSKILLLIGPVFAGHNLFLYRELGSADLLRRYGRYYLLIFLSVILYVLFLNKNYGVFSPSQLYGKNGQLFSGNPFTNILAILTDRTKGLFIYYPVLIITGHYIYNAIMASFLDLRNIIIFKKFDKKFYLSGSLAIGLILLLITQIYFDDWSGCSAPNARYMLVFVFFTIYLISKMINFKNMLDIILLFITILLSTLNSYLFIFKFNKFIEPAIDSDITSRFTILQHLPLFNFISNVNSNDAYVRSIIFLAIVATLNILLFMISNHMEKKNQCVINYPQV